MINDVGDAVDTLRCYKVIHLACTKMKFSDKYGFKKI